MRPKREFIFCFALKVGWFLFCYFWTHLKVKFSESGIAARENLPTALRAAKPGSARKRPKAASPSQAGKRFSIQRSSSVEACFANRWRLSKRSRNVTSVFDWVEICKKNWTLKVKWVVERECSSNIRFLWLPTSVSWQSLVLYKGFLRIFRACDGISLFHFGLQVFKMCEIYSVWEHLLSLYN